MNSSFIFLDSGLFLRSCCLGFVVCIRSTGSSLECRQANCLILFSAAVKLAAWTWTLTSFSQAYTAKRMVISQIPGRIGSYVKRWTFCQSSFACFVSETSLTIILSLYILVARHALGFGLSQLSGEKCLAKYTEVAGKLKVSWYFVWWDAVLCTENQPFIQLSDMAV